MTTASQQPIGSILPDFSLPDLSGVSHSLESLVAGRRGLVVVFWSGICSHCRRYDDYLSRLPESHAGVGMVAVASRQDEDAEMLRATVAERGLRFPLLHDAQRSVAHLWLVEQTPRVFLLDARRQLIYRGAIDNFKYPQDPDFVPYLDPAIESFLAGQAPPRAETPSFGCPIESVYYQLPKP